MKKIFVFLGLSAILWAACSREKGAYIDLRSGKKIKLEKDAVTGAWINSDTKEPVYIIVDTRNNDTIYGKTGQVINGHVVFSGNEYWYDSDLENEYKAKNDDYKMKVEDDGDMKIKTEDKKIKIDDGEKRVKQDN